jgi:DEAD/DEAH box helicase domain-containing protein
MDARAFLREMTGDARYRGQIAHVREIPARPAQYAQCASPLDERLLSLLRRHNIHRLYTHQASAIDAVAAGRDVVVVTATASGKTLCYNLPVAQTLLGDPAARAMYVFPTKALAQDQFGTLAQWASQEPLAGVLKPGVYDGDTPSHNRSKLRSAGNVILTNPDMLHVGILPYHGKWHAMLRELRYVVLDEVHAYRGIFGSHVAGVIRRLLRLCEHYGSSPRIICCSATIANPVELTEKLTGRSMTLVDNDGAPRGRKYFALWNPPLLDHADEGLLRRSANVEAVELLAELVRRRTQTIAFTKARIVAELVYKYACEALAGWPRGSARTAAATFRPSGGRSNVSSSAAGCWRSRPPTRWSLASTSAGWTRPSSWVSRARSARPGSRRGARGGRRRTAWWCWWRTTIRSTSTSCGIRSTCSGRRTSTR